MAELSYIPTVDYLLAQIVAQAKAVIPFDSGGIALYDRASRMLTPTFYITGGDFETHRSSRVSIDAGIVGRVARTRRPALVPDVRTDPDYITFNIHTRAELAVPLIFEDHLLGVFNLESNTVGAFTREHLEALGALAGQAAAAIGNDLLLRRVHEQLRQGEAFRRVAALAASTLDLDELFALVTREIIDLMQVRDAMFFFPEGAGETLRLHPASAREPERPGVVRGWPPDEDNLVVQVFNTRQAFVTNNAAKYLVNTMPGIQKIIAAPLVAHDEALGVLAVANPFVGDFEDAHVTILCTIADQVALSIQNARSFAAAHRRAHVMALINEIGRQITVRLDLGELMVELVEAIHDKLGYGAVHLLTLEPEHKLVVRASAAADPAHRLAEGAVLAADRGAVGRALHSRQCQLVPDLAHAPDDAVPEAIAAYRSRLAAPLVLGEQVLGVLDILSARPGAFDAADGEMIETLAGQVASVMNNAAHYARGQRRRQLGERYQAAAQAVSRQLQLYALMNVITKEAAGLFDLPAASLMSFDPDSQTLYGSAAYGLSTEYLRQRQVSVTDLPDWAERRAGQVTYYPDRRVYAHDDEQLDLIEREGLSSMLAAPLCKGAQYTGSLDFYARGEPRVFSEDEVEIARLFANRVAIALENARLFEALEVHAQELSQANRLKSEFLANVSHELRTPMNAIIGFSEAMSNGLYGPVAEKQADRLDTILRNARGLLALIEDLLDISRIGAGHLHLSYEAVPIYREIKEAVERHKAGVGAKGLALRVNLDALPPVRGDVVRLRQVLDNLISNAVKFTHEGYVEVRARVHQHDGRTWVRCTVEDSGIGIARQHQAMIFDEFRQVDSSSTREYGGTGLGLAITKKLIEMMGGQIWVSSEGAPGKGSAFMFELPVVT
ncbi:MAG: GAF domain-containing protein [Anaerolineae bacterium]|nr:GAF domain-containing protein [Anaerolineae bacterium]